MTPPAPAFTRRTLLIGAASGAAMFACGGAGGGNDEADDTAAGLDDGKGLALVRFFAEPSVLVGTSRRIVFGLAEADGTLRPSGPDSVDAVLFDASGSEVGPVRGVRRARELFRQYYQFRVDVAAEGVYTLRVSADGETAEASFSVVGRDALPFPAPGDPFPPFDTPTVADARGVVPLCTRNPMCDFHDQTLTEALAAGLPIAYLVGTPAYCDTGVCGPMLDVMISLRARYPDVVFLHAEVYIDDTATTVAPAVEAVGLSFEPVLFLIGADGVLRERLDVVFDRTELQEQLDALIV